MKKLNNNTAMALFRGAIVLAGCMTTVTAMLFCTSIYGVIVTVMLGGFAISLIDDKVE